MWSLSSQLAHAWRARAGLDYNVSNRFFAKRGDTAHARILMMGPVAKPGKVEREGGDKEVEFGSERNLAWQLLIVDVQQHPQ